MALIKVRLKKKKCLFMFLSDLMLHMSVYMHIDIFHHLIIFFDIFI